MSLDELHRLIARNEPLWGAEAEVISAYWVSPKRSRDTDRLWLERQAYKEYWDGYMPALRALQEGTETIDDGIDRREALAIAEVLTDELAHYVAFADACEALVPEAPKLSALELRRTANWPENVALGELRASHRRKHGELGERAQQFTEGGYCTLYASGMALTESGDELIRAACARVYEDEFDHMLRGIAELATASMSTEAWHTLGEITVAQLKARIDMRNAQLSFPVPPERIAELQAGGGTPIRFDFARAGITPPA